MPVKTFIRPKPGLIHLKLISSKIIASTFSGKKTNFSLNFHKNDHKLKSKGFG